MSQSYPRVDITVVDNASQDGTREWVAANAPGIRFLPMETNQGFSRSFNLGARTAVGEYILSLNPDVSVFPDCIANLVAAAEGGLNVGIVSPKLRRADQPEVLDSTGLFIDRFRRPYDRGQFDCDDGQFDANQEIFGACGAAALFRRRMLDDLAGICQEYFDEDFFAYYEDADLAWRSKLRNWRSIYAPSAEALHVRGWGDTLRKGSGHNGFGARLALRNRYLMMVKNDSLKNLLLDLPLIFLREIPGLMYMLLFRPVALAAILDFVRLLPAAQRKRRAIQTYRTVNPESLRHWFVQKRVWSANH
jgi:GT2 family glycosyltransferase